jgi:hypothetical protein
MTPPAPKERPPPENGKRDHCCKVSKIAERYSLRNIDGELLSRRDEGASLRELANYVNEQIITATEMDVGASSTTVRRVVASDSAAETDLDISTYERITTRLDNSTNDVASLGRDFVSHETVRVHLGEHLDVDTSRDPDPKSIEDTRAMIASIRDRDASIVERALEALRREDLITSGPIDGSLNVRVTCSACGRSYAVDEFLDDGGCPDCGTGDVSDDQ